MHSSKHAEDLPAPDTPAAVKDAGSKYVEFLSLKRHMFISWDYLQNVLMTYEFFLIGNLSMVHQSNYSFRQLCDLLSISKGK